MCFLTFCLCSISNIQLFHCMSSDKEWQLTYVQHTRRLTRGQHTKNGSHVAHEVWLEYSTYIVCHMQIFTESLDKSCRTQACLAHASVNLDMSCTIYTIKIIPNWKNKHKIIKKGCFALKQHNKSLQHMCDTCQKTYIVGFTHIKYEHLHTKHKHFGCTWMIWCQLYLPH